MFYGEMGNICQSGDAVEWRLFERVSTIGEIGKLVPTMNFAIMQTPCMTQLLVD